MIVMISYDKNLSTANNRIHNTADESSWFEGR